MEIFGLNYLKLWREHAGAFVTYCARVLETYRIPYAHPIKRNVKLIFDSIKDVVGLYMLQDKNDMRYFLFENAHKKIYVCLNHRAAYLCWVDANRKRFVKDNALLFHIDHHSDFWLYDEDLIDEQEKIDINDMDGLREFVRTKLSVKNSEFIVLSMYREIIWDAVSISRKNDSIYGTLQDGSYSTTKRAWFKDKKGDTHNFYLGGCSITGLTGYNGLLTDRHTHQDVQQAFRANSRSQNIILDLDLDFFAYLGDEGEAWAMNERHLERLFLSEALNYLWSGANVITIALEPYYCGGNKECVYILDKMNSLVLNKHVFNIKEDVIHQFKL